MPALTPSRARGSSGAGGKPKSAGVSSMCCACGGLAARFSEGEIDPMKITSPAVVHRLYFQVLLPVLPEAT